MSNADHHLGFLRDLTWHDLLAVLAILVVWRLLILAVRGLARWSAERVAPQRRLLILRASPIIRLGIGLAAIVLLVPRLVEPTVEDVVALLATAGVLLAFAIKDYVSCLFAGVVTIVENTYQPGDWIEFDGHYGEVRAIGNRAVILRTIEDTEVVVPHSRLWLSSVVNVSRGRRMAPCVTQFYLDADHDAAAVRQALAELGEASRFRQPDSAVRVAVAELPWGTRYKVIAYAGDSREQFAMVSDLTVRGKDRLRAMGIRFAQAPYAEPARG